MKPSTASADVPAAEIAFGPWTFCASTPGDFVHPDQLPEANLAWQPAVVPGTVASALRALGRWDLSQPLDTDSKDWWYRAAFDLPTAAHSDFTFLRFDGLATLPEVWLNGRKILATDNMFRTYRVNVTQDLKPQNELTLCFRALTTFLDERRPRPRWKTNLVSHQPLRWCRTSLLGRIPGWTPAVAPVGPWRAIQIERGPVVVHEVQLATVVRDRLGVVTLNAHLQSRLPIHRVSLVVGDTLTPAQIEPTDQGWRLSCTANLTEPPLWWPHSHGEQPLLQAVIQIDAGGERFLHPCGALGFRSLEVDRKFGFGVKVNGVPVFCRGACWTVSDMVTLDGSAEQLAHDLRLARDAGANMLRVGGTMIYESDRFYDLCDQLGILVWQDFMFANMDYPIDDPLFASNIEEEAKQQLQRLSRHPSVAIYCGNSEVEQQAAMLGVPPELWRNAFFAEQLPRLCARFHPGTEFIPSTPSGGTLPFHVASGVAHYYGVGAYLRSPDEVRLANVKFTPECLGFANVPEQDTVNRIASGGPIMLHHPRWKERVPRDTGAGWDFEDVRDHYLKCLFGVDPAHLRSFNTERYLRLSRIVTGEVMARTFAEWRSSHSSNRGALVWFFKDLWPGAGWGIVDSLGIPKAAYYYLKRSWQSRQILLTDEGLDGLHLHVINETPFGWVGFVEIVLLKNDHVVVAKAEVPCELEPRSQITLESDALLGGFYDVTYAYRFGPPKHDVVVATLFDKDHQVVCEAFHFVHAREPMMLADADINAEAECYGDTWNVTIRTNRFLQGVSFDVKGFLPNDSYFHMVPQRSKKIEFRATGPGNEKFKLYLEALNLRDPVRISVQKV